MEIEKFPLTYHVRLCYLNVATILNRVARSQYINRLRKIK